jgi:ABC-type phosphate transport system substrate-binding protein
MRTFLRLLLGILATLGTAHAHADVYVIVNKSNPIHSLTPKEAINIFMGRTHAFANGDYVLAFDLPRSSDQRDEFYQALTGMTAAQVNTYWARLVFTGQSLQPRALESEAAMIDVVKRNQGAIGYVSQEPIDKDVQVVLTLKK